MLGSSPGLAIAVSLSSHGIVATAHAHPNTNTSSPGTPSRPAMVVPAILKWRYFTFDRFAQQLGAQRKRAGFTVSLGEGPLIWPTCGASTMLSTSMGQAGRFIGWGPRYPSSSPPSRPTPDSQRETFLASREQQPAGPGDPNRSKAALSQASAFSPAEARLPSPYPSSVRPTTDPKQTHMYTQAHPDQ